MFKRDHNSRSLGIRPGAKTAMRFTPKRCAMMVVTMTPSQPQPKIHLAQSSDYRESYANSVQIRVNLWDFLLMFGTINQSAPDSVYIQNFQGVYLSPQQAKALYNVLQQNINQYEATFGEIRLEPHGSGNVIQ
jgi:hypothetical protein